MHHTADVIGACPECETPIPSAQVLIEYERGDEQAVFAACPNCTAVVHPT